MHIQECSAKNVCHTVNTSIVIDAAWRWHHAKGGYGKCDTVCSDENRCNNECEVEGLDINDYKGQGVTSLSNNGVKMNLVPGSRLYLLGTDGDYQMFKLKNREISMDIDMSTLPCGVNAAAYFIEMQKDGGMRQPNSQNKAGPKYGTGYCDAQCPKGNWLSTGYKKD